MKSIGVEWCPYCGYENDFEVEENVWIINCKECGRPLVLCDKCESKTNCKNCPYEKEANLRRKEWAKSLMKEDD